MKKASNEFDPFLNECQIYVWEWYIPEQKVRFGIPSLNSLWIDDQEKNIKLATMLERVHPDDIQKVLVRHTSPLYRSDKMFEVDLRLNVAAELKPDGESVGRYEWYGFRGKTLTRDRLGRPTYVRGVAINLDQRFRAQERLLDQKARQLLNARNQANYCAGVIQEVGAFIRNLAENADTLIANDGDPRNAEDRLMRLSSLKDQVGHILELTDKVRHYVSNQPEASAAQDIRPLALWEHIAELQQVYSLKVGGQMKFYFSNLYDDLQIYVDQKLFDVLLDNIINALIRTNVGGSIVISYIVDQPAEQLRITVSSSGTGVASSDRASVYNLTSLGQSVTRLIAKRMWGDIVVEPLESGRQRYVVTLPLDARRSIIQAFPSASSKAAMGKEDSDLLDELTLEHEAEAEAQQNSRAALPHVLIGMSSDASLYRNQHLFEVTVTCSTDELASALDNVAPDIVFVDTNLQGQLPVNSLLAQIHASMPDVPIIATADVAQRSLHKQVRSLGASYLLTNPLTLRKVNMMIKRYLK